MSYDTHFLIENVVNVTAAVIGISKQRWEALKDREANAVKAREIMAERRFDILPIVSDSGVKEYFRADMWNDYSSISKRQIYDNDIINFTTPLRDLIHRLAAESRHFFFLGNETEVVGLVSVVDLNSRQVKVYFYNLLSELEIRLGRFLASKVTEGELLGMELGNTKEANGGKNSYEESKRCYEKDLKSGVESSFIEYLYLSQFIKIIVKKDLHSALGYSRKSEFNSELGSLNDLRNQVAHPNRSIIIDANSVERLWKQITMIEKVLSHLRSIPEAVC
jgi:hypothetical protein